jgi:hypothetical protein
VATGQVPLVSSLSRNKRFVGQGGFDSLSVVESDSSVPSHPTFEYCVGVLILRHIAFLKKKSCFVCFYPATGFHVWDIAKLLEF